MEYTLFETLKEAFETSTLSNNRFKKAINRIAWDNTFFADEEYYFIKGGFTFTTPSLDPFQVGRNWRPAAIFSDCSQIYF